MGEIFSPFLLAKVYFCNYILYNISVVSDYKEGMVQMKIDWSKVEPCGKTTLGNDKKIYLEHLPHSAKGVQWKKTIGMNIYALYDNKEYTIKIKGITEERVLIIDLVGDDYNEIGFEIANNNIKKCKIGRLIRNIYVNKTIPNRQLIIDSIGEEEAKKHTCSQGVRIPIVCPNCGLVTNLAIHNITSNGFTCKYCTSGISYPERLMRETLNELKIDYKMQYKIEGYSFRYDFYLKDFNAILETHGCQHYVEVGEKGIHGQISRDKDNDVAKEQAALEYGIKKCNYHQIDCRKSELEWCRLHFIEALKQYSDIDKLTEEQWSEIGVRAERKYSSLVEVCNTYNKTKDNFTTVVNFHKEYFPELTRKEVNDMLCKGSDLGICDYKRQYIRTNKN